MSRRLVLVAAGGLGRETAEAARAAGDDVIGFVDDDPERHGTLVEGVPVLGGLPAVQDHPGATLVLCPGQGAARAALVARLQAMGVSDERYGTVVHPTVAVPASCPVAAGSVLLAGVVLTASVRVGRHVVVMPNVTLTHDDVVEDFATICAGVHLGGGVRIGRAAYVGMAASVRQGVRVGPGAVVGMGSAVLRDVPAGQTWWGVPAAEGTKTAGAIEVLS